ncbi:MAG: DPP IV N-terminal domain-containing protein, partial [Pseudohongiellaceae bacterium]
QRDTRGTCMRTWQLLSYCTLAVALAACSEPVRQTSPVTLADYQRAERFLAANTDDLIRNNILAQYWQPGERLVYRRSTGAGSEYRITDLATGSTTSLFDPVMLAEALADYSDDEIEPNDLALSAIEVAETLDAMHFEFDGERYRVDLLNLSVQPAPLAEDDEFLSPDGRLAAYIDEHNLWVRDVSSGERRQLTFDGEEHYGYATNNAGWTRDDGPVLKWSPDSRRIATFRHDGREVGEMVLYTTEVGHPDIDLWKYPLPGDEHVFLIERVVIHLQDTPRVVALDLPPDAHRSTVTDHVADGDGNFLDVEWSDDGETLAFVSSSRDHKVATLRLADPDTGAVRDIHTESVATYYESGVGEANWRVLHERGEFIWYSERDDWGHLYLYDLASGELKHPITAGDWLVKTVEHVDLDAGRLYFIGSNREPGDPYFDYLYRVNLDGSGLTLLTPEPANHEITWSEDHAYFTDVLSTPTEPGRALIRDSDGNESVALEVTDISALLDAGWVAPEPFTVKVRDGETDLHGILYRPSSFDSRQRYPVLNYLYPGPQSGSIGTRSFRAARRDKQAVAELGFFVVEVDALGTPGRSKSFHDAWHGDMGDNGLPDQMAAIRQLAARHPQMDLDRVGIWGHSGGGFASTAAILRYPEFYKVAVSGAGNHDNRNYADDWGEKWQGLLEVTETPEFGKQTNYDSQANQLLAGNLEGKLLLAHGWLDDNVHPSNTLLVVQALIEAEKEFDLVVFPEARHGFGNGRYFMKRRWDYFVRHLKGVEPPAEFRFADNIE